MPFSQRDRFFLIRAICGSKTYLRKSAVHPYLLSFLSPALAYGDDRVRTDDPLLAKQVLSQLSYAPAFLSKDNGGGPGRI